MKSAPIPKNENERLADLDQYHILDSASEQSYDQLAELASSLCNTPVALITFIDQNRQWFKSHNGIDATETHRDLSFCAHAIHQETVFEVQDSRDDIRFQDNPLVTGAEQVVFYAGAPLISPKGHKLGTLCVINHKPSALTEQQKKQLEIIAKQVVTQLELRKAMLTQNALLEESRQLAASIAAKNNELEKFVYTVSHDLKSPLISISGFTKQLEIELSEYTSDKQKHRFGRIRQNVEHLADLLSNLLQLSRVMTGDVTKEPLDVEGIIQSSWQSLSDLSKNKDIALDVKTPLHPINANRTLLSQCLTNILSNAIRYRKPEGQLKIDIHTEESERFTSIFINDNGIGIHKSDQIRVFNVFEQVINNTGNGVGLSIVKTAMEKQQGQVLLVSTFGQGSCFELRFSKT